MATAFYSSCGCNPPRTGTKPRLHILREIPRRATYRGPDQFRSPDMQVGWCGTGAWGHRHDITPLPAGRPGVVRSLRRPVRRPHRATRHPRGATHRSGHVMTSRTEADRAHDRAYDRHRRRHIRNGTWHHRMPTDRIRQHLSLLTDAGMSLNAIARAAQISPRTIWPITRSAYPHVQGPTGAAILAVQPPSKPPLPAGMADATGTSRRLQALVAIGYSISDLSRGLGYKNMQQVWEWTRHRQPTLAETSAERVSALYERLSGTPGPSTRARNDARRNEWLPPLAWEDTDIDDPAAEGDVGGDGADIVDPVAIQLALAGGRPFKALRPAEQTALFRDTADWGVTRLADRLGMSTTTVARWRGRVAQAEEVAA
jgi:hypothetical protein